MKARCVAHFRNGLTTLMGLAEGSPVYLLVLLRL